MFLSVTLLPLVQIKVTGAVAESMQYRTAEITEFYRPCVINCQKPFSAFVSDGDIASFMQGIGKVLHLTPIYTRSV